MTTMRLGSIAFRMVPLHGTECTVHTVVDCKPVLRLQGHYALINEQSRRQPLRSLQGP